MAEMRELAHGILPGVLTRGGLRAAVEALAARMPIPVDVAISGDRLPPAVESTAYFVVTEALGTIVKLASATRVDVSAHVRAGVLRVDVRDDGAGGAELAGDGLVGLEDRLAVLDGRLYVERAPSGGTSIAADIPLP
jgi:signal transduction histidine kinase